MTSRTYYRFATAVFLVPALLVGSTFTRAALVVALLGASVLIYRHGRAKETP